MTTAFDHIRKTSYTSIIRAKDTEPLSISITREEGLKNAGYEKLPDGSIAGKNQPANY